MLPKLARKIISAILLFSVLNILIPQYLIILLSFPPQALAAEDELYFIHTDHLGSTTVVTDENGDVVSQERYFPYGEDRINADLDRIPTERNFTGQIKDRSTALHYYNARYYDPALSIFISPDQAGDALNSYYYANNNPLLYVDPSGNQVVAPVLVGGALGAGGVAATSFAAGASSEVSKVMPMMSEEQVRNAPMLPQEVYQTREERIAEANALGRAARKTMNVSSHVALGLGTLAQAAAPAETVARAKLASWRARRSAKRQARAWKEWRVTLSREELLEEIERTVPTSYGVESLKGMGRRGQGGHIKVPGVSTSKWTYFKDPTKANFLEEVPSGSSPVHEFQHLRDFLTVGPKRRISLSAKGATQLLEARAYAQAALWSYQQWGRTGDPRMYAEYERALGWAKMYQSWLSSRGVSDIGFPWE